jgi:acetyl esterase
MDLTLELQRRLACSLVRAPASVLRALAGPERRSPEGFVLDLHIQVILRVAELLGSTNWHDRSLAEARAQMDRSTRTLAARSGIALTVRERRIPVEGGAITARIYTPEPRGERPLPIVVYYHGGGFVLGSLESHDGECRALAAGVRAIVVAVDYRLAPEHRFPTSANDALAAFRWVAGNVTALFGDPARIALAGDSAGGNLAAVVARETRGDAIRPAFQLLIYPALDMTLSFPSHRHFAEGLLLTKRNIEFFNACYLQTEADRRDPRASPLLADDHAGLPPAMILTAGFDPLRDEGDAYARALVAAGVPVHHRCYDGLVHGFFNMSGAVVAASRAFDDAVSGLRRALAAPSASVAAASSCPFSGMHT